MADYLVRSITDEKNVIGLACVSTDLVGEAARIHGTSRSFGGAGEKPHGRPFDGRPDETRPAGRAQI